MYRLYYIITRLVYYIKILYFILLQCKDYIYFIICKTLLMHGVYNRLYYIV